MKVGVPNQSQVGETRVALVPEAIRRLGALGVWVEEDAERLTLRLRLSNAESERLLALDGWWRVAPQGDAKAGRALLYQLGPQSFADRVFIAWSRSNAGAADPGWRDLASLPQRWTAPAFPLKAADFIRRGVAEGPPLGLALRAAEAAWIATDFPSERAALDEIADNAAKQTAASK